MKFLWLLGVHFLKCLLDLNPRRRESAHSMLRHPFLNRHCPHENSKRTTDFSFSDETSFKSPETSVESESERLLTPKHVCVLPLDNYYIAEYLYYYLNLPFFLKERRALRFSSEQ